jgi:hypothetical protein
MKSTIEVFRPLLLILKQITIYECILRSFVLLTIRSLFFTQFFSVLCVKYSRQLLLKRFLLFRFIVVARCVIGSDDVKR